MAVLIAFLSYEPGTILSGWDTLHPEFDFPLYLKRILSVWQPHQGLGAPPSQSHLAELPRVLLMWLGSLFIGASALRYAYMFLMLVVGPLGVFLYLRDAVLKKQRHAPVFAFAGALFYLLNLGTLQHFYTPLEMFVTFYGLAGWFFWALERFLAKSGKKNLLLLAGITLLVAPSSHTATLWYIFYGGLGLFFLVRLLGRRFDHMLLKRSALVMVMVLFLNAFWILPNLYYVANYNGDVQLSKTHRLLSNEFFLRSQKRGTLMDLVLMTNFPFDWGIYDFGQQAFVPQMGEWVEHSQTPFVRIWGVMLFAVAALGMATAVRKRQGTLVSFLPVLAVSVFFLVNANPPFTNLFLLLRDSLSLFRESFRFPFTKFSLIYIFLYSVFLAYGASVLFSYLRHLSKTVRLFLLCCFVIGQMAFMLPLFNTGYISREMRTNIPPAYFALYDYLDGQPKERVLTLPLHSPYGWVYHDWRYQGAGFLWFGMEQPLLDREFDRWYPYNEQAYRELSHALYSLDYDLFGRLLDKYRIGYLLVDSSVIDPEQPSASGAVFGRETAEMLSKMDSVVLEKAFGPLSLYRIRNGRSETEVITGLPAVSPGYRFAFVDEAYKDLGDYLSVGTGGNYYYPFRSFLNAQDKLSPQMTIDVDRYFYRADLLSSASGNLVLPSFSENETYLYANLYAAAQNGELLFKFEYFLPDIIVSPEEIVRVGSIGPDGARVRFQDKSYLIPGALNGSGEWLYLDQVLLSTRSENVINEAVSFVPKLPGEVRHAIAVPNLKSFLGDIPKRKLLIRPTDLEPSAGVFTDAQSQKEVQGEFVRYRSEGTIIGSVVDLPSLSQEMAYAVSVRSRNSAGLPLRLCLRNLYSRKCDIYDELSLGNYDKEDFFVLPPMKEGFGYRLEVNNISFGTLPAENYLYSVTMVPLPYEFLKNVRVELEEYRSTAVRTALTVGGSGYRKTVELREPVGDGVLFLNQAYEKGWKAYLNGRELKEHVLVSNWANGWRLPDRAEGSIQIIYLPQYLAYLGFGLAAAALAWAILFYRR